MSSAHRIALFLLVCGCTGTDGAGATPVTSGGSFFDSPWPSDLRTVDGHPDVSGFPHAGQYPIVDAYLDATADIDGFGNNSPLFVRFEGDVDLDLLPSPEGSTGPESPVYLVDIGIGSPHRGERIPIAFEWTDSATTWQPENLLAVAPVFGFPLAPATQYALVFQSPLVAPQPIDWSAQGLAALESTLVAGDVPPDTVAFAVTFTTQDPIAETARIARAIRDEIAIPTLDQELTLYADMGEYTLYVGTVLMPVWQHGPRPYHTVGDGGFSFSDDGGPEIYQWERVQFSLTIPTEGSPDDGWPLVLYSHGTGGDNFSFCNGSSSDEGLILAREGVAVFGVSQPLHGDRATEDTSVELDSFNFYNPQAGRTNFRQGALDQVYLARALTQATSTFRVGNDEIVLDPTRVAFFGHSQGGLVGALGTPFMSEDLLGTGLSGAGGGLTLTILLRKDPLDLAATFAALLSFDEDEELTSFHPVLALIQTLAEATDPINYAPYWYAEQGDWEIRRAARPMPMALTEGLLDEFTPAATSEALAAAGRMPIVGDPANDPDALALRGLTDLGFPVQDNARGWTGENVTSGMAQYPDDGHYAVYENNSAKRFYRDFLTSLLDGSPVLDE